MKWKVRIAAVVAVVALAAAAFIFFPDCSVKYDACRAWCEARYIASDSGMLGCKARCATERGACLAEQGVDSVRELGDSGVDSAQDFLQGLRRQ